MYLYITMVLKNRLRFFLGEWVAMWSLSGTTSVIDDILVDRTLAAQRPRSSNEAVKMGKQ